MILCRDGAQPQRTHVVAAGHVRLGENLGPCKHGRAGKQRRYMPPAVDRRNVKRIGEPVERERAGERDYMAAVDQAAAEAALRRRMLVEVDARGVLIESRCNLVLGLFHGYAVDMVDLLADGIINEALAAAG